MFDKLIGGKAGVFGYFKGATTRDCPYVSTTNVEIHDSVLKRG